MVLFIIYLTRDLFFIGAIPGILVVAHFRRQVEHQFQGRIGRRHGQPELHFHRRRIAKPDLHLLRQFVVLHDIVQVAQTERERELPVLLDRERRQIVDVYLHEHFPLVRTVRRQHDPVLAALDVHSIAEHPQLVNQSVKVRRGERQLGLVIDGRNVHYVRVDVDQRHLEMLVELRLVLAREMKRQRVLSLREQNVELLVFLARGQDPVEQHNIKSYSDIRRRSVVVATEPGFGDAELHDGDVAVVYALYVNLRFFEHEIDVFGHEFYVLEHRAELLAFFGGLNQDVHFLVAFRLPILSPRVYMRFSDVNIEIASSNWSKNAEVSDNSNFSIPSSRS